MSTNAAHASVDVADLDASVRFYRALFGEPSVTRSDYARFEWEAPPFVLSLVPTPAPAGPPRPGRVNHLGLRLADEAALDAWADRLRAGGVSFERETGVECCYSRQSKLWLVDPDGTLWELYVRLGTATLAGRSRHTVRLPDAGAAITGWTHRLSEGVVTAVPAADGSLDDVLLEGTFNGPASASELQALLVDARRALRPGGVVRLHGLVASSPLPAKTALPGPAAAVSRVPVEAEPVDALRCAGFVDAQVVTLPDRPNLVARGVELRELLVVARAPTASAGRFVPVTYRGPFAKVEDDRGHTYPRGERTWIDVAHRDALAAGPLADAFTLFVEPAAPGADGCCT
jgi:catechol 2,3-dioxygenase-like lactoylglutathione lyase family enzyme